MLPGNEFKIFWALIVVELDTALLFVQQEQKEDGLVTQDIVVYRFCALSAR